MNTKAKSNWSGILVVLSLLLLAPLFTSEATGATLTIHTQTNVTLELLGYDGLDEFSVAQVESKSEESITLETSYAGLALLVFSGGQSYPLILGEQSITLNIENAGSPPSFAGNEVNTSFYALLAGQSQELDTGADEFALLMLQAKKLLDSSFTVKSTAELAEKKNEYYSFVRDHYAMLRHSDMVRRLVAQSFMTHEYVDYHVVGKPASDIKTRYQQAVLENVAGWLEVLGTHIAKHDILDYCVAFYYQRSMVSLAATLVDKFRPFASCPDLAGGPGQLPEDALLTNANKSREMKLSSIKEEKVVVFVSEDCAVSMVEAVVTARRLAKRQPAGQLIVAPVQPLAENHLTINRMVSNGAVLFVNDTSWLGEEVRR